VIYQMDATGGNVGVEKKRLLLAVESGQTAAAV
jgi:hypothetical protein